MTLNRDFCRAASTERWEGWTPADNIVARALERQMRGRRRLVLQVGAGIYHQGPWRPQARSMRVAF